MPPSGTYRQQAPTPAQPRQSGDQQRRGESDRAGDDRQGSDRREGTRGADQPPSLDPSEKIGPVDEEAEPAKPDTT